MSKACSCRSLSHSVTGFLQRGRSIARSPLSGVGAVLLTVVAPHLACNDGGTSVDPATGDLQGPPFPGPTSSSPIVLSRDGRLLWVVNPAVDDVVVIRTDTNQVIA